MAKTEFEQFIADEIEKGKGRYIPVKAGPMERLFVKKAVCTILPQKVPSRYRISLHVDDESVICSQGKQYGFEAYQLDAPDDEWKEKVIARAEEIRKRIKQQ